MERGGRGTTLQHFPAADQACHQPDKVLHLRLTSTWMGATPGFRSALRSPASRTSGSAASLALHASGGPGSRVFFPLGRLQSYSSFDVQGALRRRSENQRPRLQVSGAADHRWPTGAQPGHSRSGCIFLRLALALASLGMGALWCGHARWACHARLLQALLRLLLHLAEQIHL